MPGYGAICHYQPSSAKVCAVALAVAVFRCQLSSHVTFDCELTLLALVSELKEHAPIYLLWG